MIQENFLPASIGNKLRTSSFKSDHDKGDIQSKNAYFTENS